jgi:hypothetical protein
MRLMFSCLLLAACGPAVAADLAKVDRSIAKEPSYAGKPKYCLLVFGADAKHKVWLAQDGDALYVDRDGDGDLTGAGEKVTAKKDPRGAGVGGFSFEVGELRLGGKTHKAMTVALMPLKSFAESPNVMAQPLLAAAVRKSPDAVTAMITIDVECEAHKGGGVGGRVSYMLQVFDSNGVLRLADQPPDAPVVHLDGPGTFAMVKYEGAIPENKHPRIEATYRPKGGKPFKEVYELKERC